MNVYMYVCVRVHVRVCVPMHIHMGQFGDLGQSIVDVLGLCGETKGTLNLANSTFESTGYNQTQACVIKQ